MLKTLTAILFLSVTLNACSSTASLVRADAVGGRVQLQGAYMPAVSAARTVMVESCRGRFEYAQVGSALEFRCRMPVMKQSSNDGELAMKTGQ